MLNDIAHLCWRPLLATMGGEAVTTALGYPPSLVSTAITFAIMLEVWIRIGPYTGDPMC